MPCGVRRVGVRKECYATEGWFDIRGPELSPSPELMAKALAAKKGYEWNGGRAILPG